MIDEDYINNLVRRCKQLKYKFHGVFAAYSFPMKFSNNSFILNNYSTSISIGTHWTLLCRKDQKYIFADPLGHKLLSYKNIHNRLASSNELLTVYELLRKQPIQKQNSILCGLFCIYIAHFIFNGQGFVKMSDFDLLHFALHMIL